MKKVTFILGNHNTGKTTIAQRLVEGKKAAWCSFLELSHYSKIQKDTEVLVFDEVSNIDAIKLLVCSDGLEVNKKGKPIFFYKIKELVFTSNSLTKGMIGEYIGRHKINFIETIKEF